MDCFDFVFVRFDFFRSLCEIEEGCFVYFELKFVWVEFYIVFFCCVEDIKYLLVMFCFIYIIDECVICNIIQFF